MADCGMKIWEFFKFTTSVCDPEDHKKERRKEL